MKENKLLNLLFNQPMSRLHVRQISRDINIDTKTVMKYLNKLEKEELIVRKKQKNHFPYYEANRLSRKYRFKKSNHMIDKIINSNLIEHLEKNLKPELIVLFGSMQKGTYHQGSDIDIFIKTDEKKIYLKKFEKKLGYKITLFFEKDFKRLSKGLLNNIINGYVLSGTIEVS